MTYEATILATAGQHTLVQWEGRRFPGVTIQGDSLSILVAAAEEAEAELARGNAEDAGFALAEVREALTDMQRAYEAMMASVGKDLPYQR
ncbi:DUF6959 family protein [Nocardia sp. NPDC003693]